MNAVEQKPSDILNPDVDWYVWGSMGWEDAPPGSVCDARTKTRGQAAAALARETTGHLPDVRVWKRYVRPWTRQDAWDYSGRDRWVDDTSFDRDIDYEAADAISPDEPPPDWNPPDDGPAWEFVHRSDPDAIPVWIGGFKYDEPPQNPARRR